MPFEPHVYSVSQMEMFGEKIDDLLFDQGDDYPVFDGHYDVGCSMTISNNGDAKANASQLSLSNAASLSLSINAIEAGGNYTTSKCFFDKDWPLGCLLTLEAMADAGKTVDEENENDNTNQTNFYVVKNVVWYDDDLEITMSDDEYKKCTVPPEYTVEVRKDGLLEKVKCEDDGIIYVKDGGFLVGCDIREFGEVDLCAGSILEGENVINGFLFVDGIVEDENGKIIWELNASKYEIEGYEVACGQVYGLDNICGFEYSIDVEDIEKVEEHVRAQSRQFTIGCIAADFKEDIQFMVNRKTPKEDYKDQFKFLWDEDQQKYTGINYNGFNYTLDKKGDDLVLCVTENVQTLVFWFGIKDDKMDSLKDNLCEQLIQFDKNGNIKGGTFNMKNNMNIFVVLANRTKKSDEHNYILIGNSAIIQESKTNDLNNAIIHAGNCFYGLDSSLFIFAHGGGLSINSESLTDFSGVLSSSKLHVSNIIYGTACLMLAYENLASLGKVGVRNIIGSENLMNALRLRSGLALNGIFQDGFYKNVIDDIMQLSIINNDAIASIAFNHLSYGPPIGLPDSKSWLITNYNNEIQSNLDKLARDILQFKGFEWSLALKSADDSESSGSVKMRDLLDFLEKLESSIKAYLKKADNYIDEYRAILSDINALSASVKKAIIQHNSWDWGNNGISIYLPLEVYFNNYYPFFNNTNNTAINDWGRFVYSLNSFANTLGIPNWDLGTKKQEISVNEAKVEHAYLGNYGQCHIENETLFSEYDYKAYVLNLEKTGTVQDVIELNVSSSTTSLNVTF